jgi:hypothetical protein
MMRVMFTIDDDLHAAAKAIAQHEGATLDQFITEMMRVGMQDALRQQPEILPSSARPTPKTSNDLGARIQARFKGLGQIPIAVHRDKR